jgi:uncharacterized membrane protein
MFWENWTQVHWELLLMCFVGILVGVFFMYEVFRFNYFKFKTFYNDYYDRIMNEESEKIKNYNNGK